MEIKECLRQYVTKADWFERLWIRLQWIKTNRNAARYSDVEYADLLWKYHNGQGFTNIDHPETYDEKMWFLKLANRDPLLVECSDKYALREYVKRCGYEEILKPVYGVFKSVDEIDFSSMPDRFYIKMNNGSGLNMIYDKSKQHNLKHIKWKFNFLLKQNPYYLSREWNYKDIPPRIICEEVLSMPDNKSDIPEIQFFCFHGVPKFIMYNLGLADKDGYHKTATRWVFDMDWNVIHVVTSMPTTDNPPPKPQSYQKMVEIATKVSEPFPHVRVDLFNINGKIYMNEMTFYSGGGFVKLEPTDWQKKIGSWIDCSSFNIGEDAKSKHNVHQEQNERKKFL